MFKNKEYFSIYLVTGILTIFVIFSLIALYFINQDISNNTSASLHRKKIEKYRKEIAAKKTSKIKKETK